MTKPTISIDDDVIARADYDVVMSVTSSTSDSDVAGLAGLLYAGMAYYGAVTLYDDDRHVTIDLDPESNSLLHVDWVIRAADHIDGDITLIVRDGEPARSCFYFRLRRGGGKLLPTAEVTGAGDWERLADMIDAAEQITRGVNRRRLQRLEERQDAGMRKRAAHVA